MINPIDRICEIISDDGMDSLTDAEAGFFGIYWFVLETNGGGLDTFFFNDSGRLATHAVRYLREIGAIKSANVLSKAIALFLGGVVPHDQEERRGMLEQMEEKDISFGPLTTELFKCNEDVDGLHQAYASAHPELFARILKV